MKILQIIPALLLISATALSQELMGIGRPASQEEITLWDIDVMPDGTGLPPGSGTTADGEKVYQAKCLYCHGEEGAGGPYDQLVGRSENDEFRFGQNPKEVKTIGNYWPYATTLFDYVRRAMPYDRPGSLNNQEVYSLTAYLLYLNGIIDETDVMNAQSLPNVQMPSRNRFVEDDRETTENFR